MIASYAYLALLIELIILCSCALVALVLSIVIAIEELFRNKSKWQN